MSATRMDLLGVNLAGAEFGSVGQPYGQGYTYPTHAEIDYEAAKGMNIIRLPFLWERLQPTLNGSLDAAELARIDDVVAYAASKGLTVDLDLHDYGNYNGQAVGSAAVPNSAFADLWGKLAAHFSGSPNVMFGLMNEPQQSSAAGWLQSVNAAIASIRNAGAQQEVLVPGIGYDGAWTWTANGNASVIGTGVVDPSDNYAFEVHQYLDQDGSGTHANVVSADIGVQRLQAITQWAESTGHRLFLGEFGVSADATSIAAMSKMLAYMDQHTGAWQGATYWAAGPWWGNYMYSAEPSNGIDAAQMTVLEQYKHVAAVPPADVAAGGGPTTGTPTETSPDPGATSPAPTQTSPAPTQAGPDPGATSPAPSQPSPGPATTSPAPSQPSPGPATTSPAPSQPSTDAGATSPAPSQPSSGPGTMSSTTSQASATPNAVTTTALPATAAVDPAAIANEATVSAQPDIAAVPASAVTDGAAPVVAATIAGPTITVDPSVSFSGSRSVVLSGTASAPLGVMAVDLFENGTHLGTAAIASDGTWSLSIGLRPGLHTGLSAVATDTAGNTGSAPTNYDLTTVGNRPGAKASVDNYDAAGAYLGTTQYNANGSIYLQWTTTSLPHGQTQVSYTSGTSLKQQGLSSLVETFGSSGRLVAETQTVAFGTHTLSGAGGRDTFVFKPAFGQDLITGFTASGNAHDTLSLPASAFGSIAVVLNNATQQGADTVISARNGDTITLQGFAKADLVAQDFKLHA